MPTFPESINRGMVNHTHFIATTPTFIGCSNSTTLKFDDVTNILCAECAIIMLTLLFWSSFWQFGSCWDKCLGEVSIGQDRGQEPSIHECPNHIGTVGTCESKNCCDVECYHIAKSEPHPQVNLAVDLPVPRCFCG